MKKIPLNVFEATPPESSIDAEYLEDSHQRRVNDLRLSVTDRCNFRCVYCMDPDVKYLPKLSLLSLDEYTRLVSIATSLGVDKLRITGGEPTLYPHLDALISRVGKLALRDIALTTNGSRITEDCCARWKDMGLNRVTMSLDTLRSNRQEQITRSFTPLDTVIQAIEIAKNAGLNPVKVNTVVMRGVNDDEILDFAAFAIKHEVQIRLIEFMAIDASRNWSMQKVVPASEILQTLEGTFTVERNLDSPSSTSMNYTLDRGRGQIGIIASVTQSFCHGCNRLRILADGTVRPCLFSDDEWSIRPLLRGGASDGSIRRFLIDAVRAKSAGHSMGEKTFKRTDKTMSTIGG